MYIVTLKKGEEKRILNSHPWIYANEVQKIEGKDVQGSIAKVYAFDGRFIGQGYINHLSKIIIRLLSYNEETIDDAFFYKRIEQSNNRRVELGYENNYRVVFGESDLLPGLIVDKYGDYLSVQLLTLGMDIRKETIINSLVKIFNPKGIYERSDVPIREKEGLKQFKGWIYGEEQNPKVIIEENGLKMLVDMENGQKTGYFLDQKENRDNVKHYVKDKEVLDCFCNIGGFSLCSAKYGASKVTALDISALAIETVKENAKLNNLTNIDAITADVFSALRDYRKNGTKFDVVILDPPAFTKSIDTVKAGYKGYCDINIQALKIIKKGGYLITCSCSQHLTVNLFMNMIKDSIANAKVNAQLVEFRIQGKDHATLIGLDEGLYLKVAVLRII